MRKIKKQNVLVMEYLIVNARLIFSKRFDNKIFLYNGDQRSRRMELQRATRGLKQNVNINFLNK